MFAQNTEEFVSHDVFQTAFFIENKGQFDAFNKLEDPIQFGIENKNDHVYFSKSGFQYEVSKILNTEENKHRIPANKKLSWFQTISKHLDLDAEEENENKKISSDRIRMNWINANKHVVITASTPSKHYFTYGAANLISYGYKKILYQNLYPGIDVEYVIPSKGGFKYSLIVHPGADLARVQFSYVGTKVKVSIKNGQLLIQHPLVSLQESELLVKDENGHPIKAHFTLNNNCIGFQLEEPMDSTTSYIVDPWVAQITTMITTGLGSDKGYEVDYDYLGNLYVYGGGYYSGTSPGNFKVAKYDLSGNLKWTFNGAIPIINWQSKGSNGSPGNFLVDKVTSKIYVSQGFENSVGSRIIRLDSFGVYNNYVSVPNISLTEIWEMAFDCKSKSIFCMGGSTSSNQNIGKIDTLGNFFPLNFTGVPTGVYPSGFSQDVVCAALDESQNLFTLISSAVTPSIDNHIFKLNSTYNGTVWNSPTGFISFVESNNKPYFSTYSSNSFNGLDVNAGYLFYYDGFNVAAYYSVNGNLAGSTYSIFGNSLKGQGGIAVDNCNNVYVGSKNGTIKVLHWYGSLFGAYADINIPNSSTRRTYDIKLNKNNKKLYVCGDSFVAVLNASVGCAVGGVQIAANAQCPNKGVVNVLNPDPNANYTFIWRDSLTKNIVRSINNVNKFTDTLTGITPFKVYTVTVISNPLCGGPSKTVSFLSNYFTASQTIHACSNVGYSIGTHVYFASGTYKDTVYSNGCATIVTTTLVAHPSYNVYRNYALCSGNAAQVGNHFYGVQGQYADTLYTYNYGCDSIINSNVIVGNTSATSQTITACTGHPVQVGNKWHSTSGIYHDTLYNYVYCDSVVVSNITFYSPSSYTQTVTICANHPFYVGTIPHYYAGIYIDHLNNYHGCDSTVITYLTVINYVAFNQTVYVCQGTPYTVGNHTYNSIGYYNDTLQSYTGCDSIVSTYLNWSPIYNFNQYVTTCSNYPLVIGNKTHTTSGIYFDTLQSIYGCDSFVNTLLTVLQAYNYIQTVSLCTVSSITVGSHTYTIPGLYHDTLTTTLGCDSIIHTHLAIGTNTTGVNTVYLCTGGSIHIGNHVYTATGTYHDTIPNVMGCDSFVTSIVVSATSSSFTQTLTRCSNHPLQIGSHIHSTSGTYIDTIPNYKNCDSIITSHLTIKPYSATTQTLTRCSNHPLIIGSHLHSVSGIYNDTLPNHVGCDSIITTNLTVRPISVKNLNANLCIGGTYTVGNHTYSIAGTYHDTLQNYLGCDSFITTQLIIRPKNNTVQVKHLCPNQTITVGTHIYSNAGIYHDTLMNKFGCDSTVQTTVIKHLTASKVQTLTICNNHPLQVGTHFYTSSGTYHDTLATFYGCDSFIITNLTVKQASSKAQSFIICAGNSIKVGTHTYTTSGIKKDTLLNAVSCDSFITTTIVVRPKSSVTKNYNRCFGQSIQVGTHTYSAAGTYHDTLLNKYGCDSVTLTHLYIYNPKSKVQNVSICSNKAYTIGIHSYTVTGTYQDTLNTFIGCDSIVTTNLIVKSTTSFSQNLIFCNGNTVVVGTHTYSVSGIYLDTLINHFGCDSFVTTNLTIKHRSFTNLVNAFCSGNSIQVGTHTYTSSGSFSDTLVNYLNCDSIITLQLTVYPKVSTNLSSTICQGQSITIGTHTYSVTGNYHDTLSTYHNCDSVVNLNLVVNKPSYKTLQLAICNGSAITIGTHVYTISGTYLDTLVNAVNCDSVITLNLTVNNSSLFSQSNSICYGEKLTVGMHTYDSSGSYIDSIINQFGCDSIIHTNLVVIRPAVKIVASPDTLFFLGESISLKAILAHSNDSILTWSPVDRTQTIDKTTISTTPLNNSWYYIKTTTTEGCLASDSIFLVLVDIVMPNAFTPNKDGQNEVFIAKGRAVNSIQEFKIYNRWGETVFETTDYNLGWDGNYKNTPQEVGTYYFVLKAISKNTGESKTLKGNFMLVR